MSIHGTKKKLQKLVQSIFLSSVRNNFLAYSYMSKLKVEFNYSTIASTIQLFDFIINVLQNTLPKGFRVS